jgi:antitoxin component YwqK of YwqJK toxin-antitoxin module
MLKKKNYVNGQKICELTGDRLTYYYKSGAVKAEGSFINDVMEGEWRFYRETGELSQIGNFRNGIKNGLWIRYDRKGNPEYNKMFREGKAVN